MLWKNTYKNVQIRKNSEYFMKTGCTKNKDHLKKLKP